MSKFKSIDTMLNDIRANKGVPSNQIPSQYPEIRATTMDPGGMERTAEYVFNVELPRVAALAASLEKQAELGADNPSYLRAMAYAMREKVASEAAGLLKHSISTPKNQINSLLSKTSEDLYQATSSPEKNVRTVLTHRLEKGLADPDSSQYRYLSKGTPNAKGIIKSELDRRKALPLKGYFRGGQKDIDSFRDDVTAYYNPTPDTSYGIQPTAFETYAPAEGRRPFAISDDVMEHIFSDKIRSYPYQLGQYKATLRDNRNSSFSQPYTREGLSSSKYTPGYHIGTTPGKDGTAYVNPITVAHEYAHGRFGMDEPEADLYAATTDYDIKDLARWYLTSSASRVDPDEPPLPGDDHFGPHERMRLFASRFNNEGVSDAPQQMEETPTPQMEKTQSVREGCGCGDCGDSGDLADRLLDYAVKVSGVQKKYQSPDGGLNRKGRAHFKRTEGANLKRPVSAKQAKKSPKSAKRRKSFCARMGGMKKKHNIDCSKTPDKSICKALRKWDC